MPVAAGIYYFAHKLENNARPAIFFIHGAGGTHLSWPPQMRRLHDRRVIAVDLPGHGKSESAGRQNVAEYAEDMAAFMKTLQLSSAVMVGHSMGGAIALQLAISFPELVHGLILIGSGVKLRVAPTLLELASKADTFPSAVEFIIENSFSGYASQRVKELTAQRMLEIRPPVLYGDFLTCDGFNVADELHRIKAPTLVLCGEEDKMTPRKYSEQLHEGIPGSQLVIAPKAGHMLMLEQPDTVVKSLERFLDPQNLGSAPLNRGGA